MSNKVTLVGRISSEFTHDHETYGEKYYRVTVSIERISGVEDHIPVILSDRLINIREIEINTYVAVIGQFRSYKTEGKLLLFVFALEVEEVEPDNINDVLIEGYVAKLPVYRLTPLGREITDIRLTVPRDYGKVDCIPCVCWGRTAKYVSRLNVGTTIRVAGRVQSREYEKNGETKTAYELSVNLVEEC